MASRQSIYCRACSSFASSSTSSAVVPRTSCQVRTFASSSLLASASSPTSPPSAQPSFSSSASPSIPRKRRQLQPIRLSTHFSPTQKASQPSSSASSGDDLLPSLQLLLRGGYVRSSSSGVFTLLPNALRIVNKITAIIDEELAAISASRLALPNLLPSKLWRHTGRYVLMGSELYKLRDRKDSEFVLGPTHEEEITKLVAHEVDSDRQLPLRLYQITRKFRDEPRPRMGLLRTKEFLMKDLYSFDKSDKEAMRTYDDVRAAYARVFDRVLGAGNWKAAEADTGAIGGNKSHEYHVEDAAGEDTLLSCTKCSYTANTEKAVSMPDPAHMPVGAADVRVLLFGCTDVKVQDQVLHAVVLPVARGLNETKLDKLVAKLSTSAQQLQPSQDASAKANSKADPAYEHKIELLYDSASSSDQASAALWDWKDRPEGPLVRFTSLSVHADFECASLDPAELNDALLSSVNAFASRPNTSSSEPLALVDLFPTQFSHFAASPSLVSPPLTLVDVRTAQETDTCPSCRTPRALRETKAIEIGHTFYLGEKYSRALEAGFLPSADAKADTARVVKLANGRVPFQMGCYGIGVSRILGALAQKAAADFDRVFNAAAAEGRKVKAGLLWPRQVAPFAGVIIVADPRDARKLGAAQEVFDRVVAAARRSDRGVSEVLGDVVAQHAGSAEKGQMGQGEREGKGWSIDEAHELVIDDRNASIGSKLADSDLTGYAFRLIIGKHFNEHQANVELQYASDAGWSSLVLPLDAFGPA